MDKETIPKLISDINYVKSADIPNIDLYMDQVTSFMETQLKSTKRNDDDKVLTKTMINNYAKNDLLPAPLKKKYSKEHLLILTFIYYFKNILTMKDIEMILKPITEKYFNTESEINFARIYDEVCSYEAERVELIQNDIDTLYNKSLNTFSDVEDENRDELQFFAFICSLTLDVYAKKLLIERLIDEMPSAIPTEKEKDKDKKKK